MVSRRDSTDPFSSRSSRPGSASAIWQSFKAEILFGLALIVGLLFGGFTSHPGLLLAGVSVLIDLLVWRRVRTTLPLLVLIVAMNVVALIFILTGGDFAELWLTGTYGLYAIFLLLLRH